MARLVAIVLVLVSCLVVAFLVGCPPASVTRPPGAESAPAAGGEAAGRSALPAATPPERPRPEREGLVAVIIDDAGYSLEELQPFLDLPGPLTISVLPNLPHSAETARRVLAAGKDLILHCPMEAEGGANPGPGALLVGQSPPEIEARLAAAFASVPGARGMNNHMGSRATADAALMTTVLEYLRREHKFFIDSRTTPDTVGPRIARALGVPFAERDIFVDDDPARDAVEEQFTRGMQAAKVRGTAILIGHVQNRAVVDILRAAESGLSGQEVRFARLADVMTQRERNPGL